MKRPLWRCKAITGREMNSFFSVVSALSSLDVKAWKTYGWSLCNDFLKWAAIQEKLGTKPRQTVRRPKNERDSVTFVAVRRPLVAFAVWSDTPRRLSWILWLKEVIGFLMHDYSGCSKEPLLSCTKVDTIWAWVMCSLRHRGKVNTSSREKRADRRFAQENTTSMVQGNVYSALLWLDSLLLNHCRPCREMNAGLRWSGLSISICQYGQLTSSVVNVGEFNRNSMHLYIIKMRYEPLTESEFGRR